MDPSVLIRPEVLSQQAYPVETTDGRIRLDANENPLTLPEGLRRRLAARLAAVAMNRYPEAGSPSLAARFAAAFGVGADRVMLGNGSDELIQILCTAMARPGATVLLPAPTFPMYGITARNNGLKVETVPLDGAFDLDLPALRRRMAACKPVLTFLARPNNPTGNLFRRAKVEALLAEASGIVVVDEAYVHFSRETLLPLMEGCEHLVILRTLSKVGLAALRIGLLVASPPLVRELHKVRLPYNLNALSQAAAGFYLDEEPAFWAQAEAVCREREVLFEALVALPGVHPRPTAANFIFFHCDFDSDRVYKQLLERGIRIKNFNAPGILKNGMRVTVGTREENAEFIEVLRDIIAK